LQSCRAITIAALTDLSEPPYSAFVAKAGITLPIGITYCAETYLDIEKTLSALAEVILAQEKNPDIDAVFFSVTDKRGEKAHFKCVRHPGDDGKPVLTIMTLGEQPDAHTPTFETTSFGQARVSIGYYADNDAIAVELLDESGESLAMLSVNLPEEQHLLGEKEFSAKTYSENEELARDALRSGLFLDTGRRAGFIQAPIWKILF
jgi:hypothetical protein